MNILVDIGHPAQLHLFKFFIREMEGRGHKVIVYAREKDSLLQRMKQEGINYLIDAVDILKRKYGYDVILHFVGEGAEEERLKKQVEWVGLEYIFSRPRSKVGLCFVE